MGEGGNSRQAGRVLADFTAKAATYHARNYTSDDPRVFARRLRRDLVSREAKRRFAGGVVLDVGCGPSVLFEELVSRAETYVAADLVPANLERVRESTASASIETKLIDLDRFDPDEWSPNLLICAGALEYAVDPYRALGLLIECLPAGGTAIISLPNRRSAYRLWAEHVYRPLARTIRRQEAGYSRTLFSARDVRRVVARRSGVAIEIRYFGFNLLPTPLDAKFARTNLRFAMAMEARDPRRLRPLADEMLLIATRVNSS